MCKNLSVLFGLFAAALLFAVSGCARDTRIVSISVQPSGATFVTPTPGGEVHFTALGSFIHPPGTRDITTEVTWKADVPQLVNVTNGVVTTTGACGITNISASTNKD